MARDDAVNVDGDGGDFDGNDDCDGDDGDVIGAQPRW